jgi:cbb3-type cytochrome c oxidase subunit III
LIGIRLFAFVLLASAGSIVVQFTQKPIHAAQQSSAASGETARQVGAPSAKKAGAELYAEHCAICHGAQREGILPGFPPLVGIEHQMSDDKIAGIIHTGKGRMPGFATLQDGEISALVHYLTSEEAAPLAAGNGAESPEPAKLSASGEALFQQNCAFCHGRDAMGGESGPDLTQSKLVRSDTTGEKIAAVVRGGRPAKKMPAFSFNNQEISSLVAFIHEREAAAAAHPGGRRGVAVADLQTGNVEAGKQYFNGTGGCEKCHSPQGDLAGIATRYEGLQLEERMLYPEGAKSKLTVTLTSGEKISGTLAYLDEFTVGLRDDAGVYHSWATRGVKYKVDSPVDAHVELFSKYTDDDIHNLMAYLQTLR